MEPRTAASARVGGDAEQACHDLLVAMAGRLPDRLLWRLRDWLAAGAHVALRTSVARSLLRHRVGITDGERALLREVVIAWGGSTRHVDAVLHADAAPEAGATFADEGEVPGWDTVDLVLRAVVPAFAEVDEVRRAWRTDRGARRAAPVPPSRVVLIRARSGLPALAAAVARALRAHGESAPRVEVVGPATPTTAYHRDALAASEVLWRAGHGPVASASETSGAQDPSGVHRPSATPELVGHG